MANCLFISNGILKKLIVVHSSLAENLYLCIRYALHVSAKIQLEDAERLVDMKTIHHTYAREIGAELVCLQAACKLISGN